MPKGIVQGGVAGFGSKLFAAFRAGQSTHLELMQKIASYKNAEDTARRTIAEIDDIKLREFEEAEKKSRRNPELLARLKAPVYQWHVRAKTVLSVIVKGQWKKVSNATTYAELYARSAPLVRPARRRGGGTGGGTGAVVRRQMAVAHRIIQRADETQALELLTALVTRLEALEVNWSATLAKSIKRDTKRFTPKPVRERAEEAMQRDLPLLTPLKAAA